MVAVPLVTKGMAENDGSVVDMNYFLGIRSSDGVLGADFEDRASGANHPVFGTTAIPANGAWHHAAATYDGTTWRLYLDGALQTTLPLSGSFIPRYDSTQWAAIGSASNSTGGVGTQTRGFFDGRIDEVRIWNYARSQAQISAGINQEISSASGLLGRWGFNEGIDTTVGDGTGNGHNGTIIGANYAWSSGAPFQINKAPAQPGSECAAERRHWHCDVAEPERVGLRSRRRSDVRHLLRQAGPGRRSAGLHPRRDPRHAALRGRSGAGRDLHGADPVDRRQPGGEEHRLRHPPRRHRRAHRRPAGGMDPRQREPQPARERWFQVGARAWQSRPQLVRRRDEFRPDIPGVALRRARMVRRLPREGSGQRSRQPAEQEQLRVVLRRRAGLHHHPSRVRACRRTRWHGPIGS